MPNYPSLARLHALLRLVGLLTTHWALAATAASNDRGSLLFSVPQGAIYYHMSLVFQLPKKVKCTQIVFPGNFSVEALERTLQELQGISEPLKALDQPLAKQAIQGTTIKLNTLSAQERKAPIAQLEEKYNWIGTQAKLLPGAHRIPSETLTIVPPEERKAYEIKTYDSQKGCFQKTTITLPNSLFSLPQSSSVATSSATRPAQSLGSASSHLYATVPPQGNTSRLRALLQQPPHQGATTSKPSDYIISLTLVAIIIATLYYYNYLAPRCTSKSCHRSKKH